MISLALATSRFLDMMMMPAPDADSDAADGRRTETSQPANVTAALLLRCAAAVVVALLQRDEGNDKELFCLS